MEHILVEIRPQLIPFLFKEFEGNEAGYMDKKVKTVRFLPASSITKYLYNQIEYKKKINKKQDDFVLFLSIEQKRPRIYTGIVYINSDGVKEALKMGEDKVKNFNNLLEDLFRISFTNFIDGYIASGSEITKGIDEFIDKYDLLEVGFEKESLRQLYYREKKSSVLSRLQFQSSNRVYNYL